MLTLIIILIAASTFIGCAATLPNYKIACELYILTERIKPSKQHYYKCAMKGNEANYWLIVARNKDQAIKIFSNQTGFQTNSIVIL